MSRTLLCLVLATGFGISASAQTHIDALPQPLHTTGHRLTADDFTPAPCLQQHRDGLHKSAVVHYSYNASGTDENTQKSTAWTMLAGKSDGTSYLQDIIPDCFDAGGLAVPYSIVATKLRIEPTYLGSTSAYKVILFSTMSDGAITFNLEGNGRFTVDPEMAIIYGAFTSEHFDLDDYQGYYEYVSGLNYTKDILVGDANEDGDVSSADAKPIVGHILGRTDNSADPDAMDTNTDREINVADIIGLSKIISNTK